MIPTEIWEKTSLINEKLDYLCRHARDMIAFSELCPTMLLLRFLSTLQKVWGGVSPLPGMMMQTSVTASEVWGWLFGARR